MSHVDSLRIIDAPGRLEGTFAHQLSSRWATVRSSNAAAGLWTRQEYRFRRRPRQATDGALEAPAKTVKLATCARAGKIARVEMYADRAQALKAVALQE